MHPAPRILTKSSLLTMSRGFRSPFDFKATAVDFVADLGCSCLIHGKGVVVEGELVCVIVFVKIFYFVDHVFWGSHTVFLPNILTAVQKLHQYTHPRLVMTG